MPRSIPTKSNRWTSLRSSAAKPLKKPSKRMSGNIAVRYELQRSDFSLDVDIDIPMRGITGVFGESGAGKTALLRCIAGLERAASGRLVVADEVWQDETRSRPVHDRETGYVFQEPRLFAHLNVRQNIEYGQRRGRREDVGFDEAVGLLGLRYLLERSVDTLSGGADERNRQVGQPRVNNVEPYVKVVERE